MDPPIAAHDAIFDHIMETVGDNGPFQRRFNYIFNIGLVFCASLVYNNMLFALSTPEHWCYVPGRENTNFSIEEWRNFTLPRKLDNRGISSYSQCQMYNVSFAFAADKLWDYENANFSGENVVDCMHGYEYDKQWYESTAASQENWVCGKELYRTNTFAFCRIGEVFGTFFFGQLGDTLGRRMIYYVSVLILLGGRIATIFTAPWYTMFIIAATFGSLTANSIFQSPLIIALETSKPEKRALIAMLQNLAWTTAMCLMPLICWLVRDWTTFLWITTLPLAIFLFFPKYMIESPRWLASVGKLDKCAKYLLDIARINGKSVDISEIYLKKMLPDNNKVEHVYGMLSFFIGWRIAMNTILLVSCWVVAAVAYFTLLLSVAELPGNPFVNFFVQSLVEFPSFFIGQSLCNSLGRRLTNAASFAAAGALSVVLIFIVNDLKFEVYSICLTILVKSCVSISFFVIYLQSMETYPTCLRQTGISLGMVASNAFGAVGPYIVYLGANYDQRYPYMILSGLFVIGMLCGMFTPETLHTKLPDSLEEAMKFGADQKFWSIPRPLKPETNGKCDKDDEAEELNQQQFSP